MDFHHIGLAGCGIGVKMEVGFGMTEILLAGCEIKILQRERDLLILIGRMRDSFKIDGGLQENRKSHVTDVTRRTASLTERDRDKLSDQVGIAGLRQK